MSKFQKLALGFNEALGGGKIDAGIGGSGKMTSPVVGEGQGDGPLSGGSLVPDDGSVTKSQLASILSSILSGEEAKLKQRQSLEDVEKQIADAVKKLDLAGKVTTKQRNDGLEVTLVTDEVLFASGSGDLAAGGRPLLDAVEEVLAGVSNPILVNGYTDNVPISGGRYASNISLSSARASAVVEYFIARGMNPAQLTPAGRGELDPVAPNDTSEGRAKNRRVEIIIQSQLVKKTLSDAGLDDKPTTPTTAPVGAPISSHDGATPQLDPNLDGHKDSPTAG
jgi:chemotaxis protein MotB